MDPDIDDIKKKLEGGRDFLDNLMMKIPGFTGYVEQTELYDADNIVRTFMAERFMRFKKSVDAAMSEALKRSEQKVLPDLDSLNLVLERVMKKCRYADYGSSSFSGVRITAEDQERILAFDWSLTLMLDEIETLMGRLSSSGELVDAIAAVKEKIADFEHSFEKRKSVILEVI